MPKSQKIKRPISLVESSFIIASQAAIIKRQRVEIERLKPFEKLADTLQRELAGLRGDILATIHGKNMVK